MKPSDRIFVAIDRMSAADARADIARVAASGCGVKLGLEFFVANGPAVVRAVCPPETPLFLDLKLHDIPNTVAGATRGACAVQPQLLTIHAAGGLAMMQAAVAAARETAGAAAPKLLAITVLTSLDETDLEGVGQRGPIVEQVKRLAELAQRAGVGGVVCSPQEVAMLRRQCGPGFLLVTPGIRPSWAAAGDQKRITTPRDAIAMGADHLVIGRPVTQANDPAAALDRICAEIGEAA
ncbi:MAG: orotidine-5'-phosphate decarboxylase [Alphaproteobacteria bacterium]|nr:orotidine-5'-phosphate decarboxylase [Alphaproteobacteria bacterium]